MTERGRCCPSPLSFPRKRESRFPAWIPGHRCTQPGMTERGRRCLPPPSFPRKRESRFPGVDSGSSLHSARNDGEGMLPLPTVIPAKAGIQIPGMDSGSSLRSARNDGEGTLPLPTVISAKARYNPKRGCQCLRGQGCPFNRERGFFQYLTHLARISR